MSFRYIQDPGHGWVEVAVRDLLDVGLIVPQISDYSYYKPSSRTFYLEEDCDAPKFVEAYKRKHGKAPEFTEVYQERTFVRLLPRLGQVR